MLPSDLRSVGKRSLHLIRRLMMVLEARYVEIDQFQLGRSMNSSKSMKWLKVI